MHIVRFQLIFRHVRKPYTIVKSARAYVRVFKHYDSQLFNDSEIFLHYFMPRRVESG